MRPRGKLATFSVLDRSSSIDTIRVKFAGFEITRLLGESQQSPTGGWYSKNKLLAGGRYGVPLDPFLTENKTKVSLWAISHSSMSYRCLNVKSDGFRVQTIKAEPVTRSSGKHAYVGNKAWRIRIWPWKYRISSLCLQTENFSKK